MEHKKFERSSTNVVVGGVCAGLADYFNMDVSLMRVLFVVAAFCGSFGFWLYIILWAVTPKQNLFNVYGQHTCETVDVESSEEVEVKRRKGAIITSMVLIAIGLMALVDNFVGISWIWKLWPLILIAIGVVIIINTKNRQNNG